MLKIEFQNDSTTSVWVDTSSALSASLQKIAHLVGRLGSGPCLVGWIGSGVRVREGTGSVTLTRDPTRDDSDPD